MRHVLRLNQPSLNLSEAAISIPFSSKVGYRHLATGNNPNLSVTQTSSSKRVGKRKWLTRKEPNEKFGEEVAGILVARKSDPEATNKEWREHPDLPGVEAHAQDL